MAIFGWILALGLSGFAAFRIKLSKSGIELVGGTVPALQTGNAGLATDPSSPRQTLVAIGGVAGLIALLITLARIVGLL